MIIGGGHNGLVCAAYLAKGGFSIAVIEQKQIVGGCVVTEEVAPGWRINTYSFEHYIIQNTPIISDLELAKFGLEYYSVDPTIFSPFKDGKAMFFHRNLSKTLEAISRVSKHDSIAYQKFHEKWSKVSRALGKAALEKPLPLEKIVASSFLRKDRSGILEELRMASAKILSETFETEYVSSPIAFLGPAAVGQDPASPGTGWLLAWHIGAENLARPRGGSGKLSEALEAAAKYHGALVVKGEKVTKILVKNGRACGVKTSRNRAFEADVVVSNADPRQTLLELLPKEELQKSTRNLVEKIKVTRGFTFKADYLLSNLPVYSCMKGRVSPNESHTAATFIADSVASISESCREFSEGKNPKEPALMVAMHSASDPSLVSGGKHGLVLETRYSPYNLGGKRWNTEETEREAQRLLSNFSEYCPGVERLVERHVAMSPSQMERDVLIPSGNFMHADMALDQMFDSRPVKGLLDGYRVISIPGLYLCGAGTHPGGAVSGIPGRNASIQIMEDRIGPPKG